MNELILAKLVDLAFTAAEVGLERAAVIEKVKAMEEAGKTPAEVYDAVKQMMNDAIQELLNSSNG